MAVLKDLIVHGSSRFLNKIYANQIQAESGFFNKLIAKDLQADKATVIGLLDVKGQLHTSSWTNSNIATIDGSFYITPTISSNSGKFTLSSNKTTATLTGTWKAMIIGEGTVSDVSDWNFGWGVSSKVLVTGEILVENEWMPLGTLKGTLNTALSDTSVSSLSLIDLSDNHGTSPAPLVSNIYDVITTTQTDYRNIKISMYQRYDSSVYKPLGIYMTALGERGKTFIDIYGGVNQATTQYGGFADPNVRIGNLSGLPAVGNQTPVGWGIYTTNGYFKGTIAAQLGVIGGFTIGTNEIKKDKTSYSETGHDGVWLGADGIGLGKGTFYVTQAGVLTAKSGTIAGWSFNSTSLYKTNATPGYNASTMVLSTGTASTNNIGGGGTSSKTWMISAGTGFGVTTAGTLYCNDAHISGEITATSGTIASSVTIGSGGVSLSTVQSNASNGKEAYDLQYSSDTRNKNENPQYYITNYPRKQVNEFKSASTIGLTSGNGYCTLTTIVPWGDSSGGYPKQEANFNGKRYWRQGISATAWSAWVDASAVATSYITNIDSNKGITIKPLTSSGNDYLQINSSSIDFYRGAGTNGAAVSVMGLSDDSFRIGVATQRNIYIDTNSINIRNGQDVLAEFGTKVVIGKSNSENITIESGKIKLNAEDGSNALRIGFNELRNSSDTTIGYGTFITGGNGSSSYIQLLPTTSNGTLTGALALSAKMSRFGFQTSSSGAGLSISEGGLLDYWSPNWKHLGFDENQGLSVDVDIKLSIDTSATSGTTDGALYAAITAMSWESEVIV